MIQFLQNDAETNTMLEAISLSFLSHRIFLNENPYLYLVFFAIIALLVFLYFFTKWGVPSVRFALQNPVFTKKLLEYSAKNHSIFNVQILSDVKYPAIEMEMIKFINGSFWLRALKKDSLMNAQELQALFVRCTLLAHAKASQGYYVFTTKVLSEERAGGYLTLVLAEPTKMEKLQRRDHLRIEPRPEHILGMAIWSEVIQEGYFVNLPRLWGKPVYSFVPGKVNQIRMMNLSSSGTRLIIAIELDESRVNLSKKSVLLLDLWDPEVQQKVRYWIRCVEQNSFKIRDTNAVEIGLSFREWTTAPLHDETIHFIPVSKDGEVPPIANWTMRRYLEQYREDLHGVVGDFDSSEQGDIFGQEQELFDSKSE
ncbi:MAG: hypothetical protein ACRCV3_02780 [Desulfovibrionaceae bacterium]